MNQSKMTPGPWCAVKAGNQIGRGKPRGGRDEEDIAMMSKWRGDSEEEATANAIGIAALPDLIEALTACERQLESYREGLQLIRSPAQVKAQAALAKAGVQ